MLTCAGLLLCEATLLLSDLCWGCLFGPAGLPAPIVARAAPALAVATQDRDLIARMGEQGVVLEVGGPEVLARTLAEELVMWGDLIRSQNIKPE
jgi:tripartite-type tricarboxylate transporter receptor subunit TctC